MVHVCKNKSLEYNTWQAIKINFIKWSHDNIALANSFQKFDALKYFG